jgi:hypothetical protein
VGCNLSGTTGITGQRYLCPFLIMRTHILLVAFSLMFASCSWIHFLSVREQKPESRKDYQTYLRSYGYDTVHSFQLLKDYYDSISHLPYAINTYKLRFNAKASPIQIRVYDSWGHFVNGYEQCFGELKKTGLLDSFPLKRINHLPLNYNLSLRNDIKLFISDAQEQAMMISKAASSKYTFILFYSMWAGYYSNNTLKLLLEHLSEESTNILLIKVNTSPDLK